ncbi:MAG: hypothetical protein H7315_22700 [Herminiimonas sp.]|nr:hypothetical protein [Herminiimonas sp.]
MPGTLMSDDQLNAALGAEKQLRYKKSAQFMMLDALQIVKKDHTGSKANFFKNAAVTGLQTMSRTDMASTAVGLALTGGVLIATLATGGLALPVLIALGAGGYALKKAIEEIGADLNRNNRNWLQRFSGVTEANGKEAATFLTCEAADALRRAIDHYRIVANTIIPNELKPQDEGQYANCDDVINHVKAVARFIHHADKVRNYTLPVLDMLIFYLEQYDLLAKQWAEWEPKFHVQLVSWFASHPACTCAKDAKHVCYAQSSRAAGYRDLFKPHAAGDTGRILPAEGSGVPATDGIEIANLLEAMKAARTKIISGMHLSSSASWNYSAERPATAPVAAGRSSTAHMQKRRLDMMIDSVWKQVDQPGRMSRAGRRMEHWYTRHNKTEKMGSIMSEMLSVGSIFMPFLKGADALSEIGKSAVSGSVSVTSTIADKIGLNQLKSAGAKPLTSGLLSHTVVEKEAADDIRGSGVTVQKLMPKLMLHFSRAASAITTLTATKEPISSCSSAFGYCILASEIVHEMEKVGRYLGPCIGIVDLLGSACDTWAHQEDKIWRDMEAYVGEWVRDDEVHQSCRAAGSKCYGSKHFRADTNVFGRGGTWREVSNDPHNPL